jgi:DNA-binding NarL/FixJ family response regulator
MFLETFDDLELVGEAQDGIEVLRMCAQRQPNIVLMSVNLKRLDGVKTTRLIRAQFPQIHVVILSFSEEPEALETSIQAGASSFLLKRLADIDVIAGAIRAAVN